MTRSMAAVVCLLAVAAGCRSESEAEGGSVPRLPESEIAEHIRVLASDAYMGRGSGQEGGRLAADYIAQELDEMGLEPPQGGYQQPFPMVDRTPLPGGVDLQLRGPGGRVTAGVLDDYVLSPWDPGAPLAQVEGEVVFVGYGIDAPEEGWNDYADLDLRGKVVLILVGDPPAPTDEPDLFGGAAMTYYGRWSYKYEEAARQGAAGALIVHDTEAASYPWSVVRSSFGGERLALPGEPGGADQSGVVGWVSSDLARRLLRAGGLSMDTLRARAARRGFRAVPTGVTAVGRVESVVSDVQTANVAGLVRGGARPDEYVVVSAHYDHLGIGEPVDGDSIYNGAYDNASGVALLLAMAGAVESMEPPPGRSILFLFTGAEEQGLLGSEWYVRYPLVPLEHTLADLNFDGVNLWGRTEDVIVLGAERSDLGEVLRSAAREEGMSVSPDPHPEAGNFFRSDHLPFARAGVPSVSVEHGLDYVGRPQGWGADMLRTYTADDYHAPSDEWSDDFVLDGAVQEGEVGLRAILALASLNVWPAWHDGQEFKAARDSLLERR